jgi:hypothetical protein
MDCRLRHGGGFLLERRGVVNEPRRPKLRRSTHPRTVERCDAWVEPPLLPYHARVGGSGQLRLWASALVGVGLAQAILAGGCAPELRAVDLADLGRRHPASLVLHTEQNQNLWAATDAPAPLVGPVVIALASYSAGSRIVRDTGLVDPTPTLGEALGRDFAHAHGLKIVSAGAVHWPDPRDNPPIDRGSADLILDVRTTSWSIDDVPWTYVWTPSKQYFVHLELALKLYDGRDGTVLAERICVGDDPKIARAQKARSVEQARALESEQLSWVELMEDRGAGLKEQVTRAAARCDLELRSKVLRLPPAQAAAAPP